MVHRETDAPSDSLGSRDSDSGSSSKERGERERESGWSRLRKSRLRSSTVETGSAQYVHQARQRGRNAESETGSSTMNASYRQG